MKPLGAVRFGIDIGGTFTDLVAIQDGRVIGIEKVLTTPEDPSIAVAEGVRVLLARTLPDQVAEVVHGTTLVPNALIERRGALTALLTTGDSATPWRCGGSTATTSTTSASSCPSRWFPGGGGGR